ncbi:LacI family DNA-binding transcriptional regulator [Paenibacillus contaminans]|uniref:LacI family transcriptional regulator n=1 Tax=Paenibacillus contaminans TaxID=450362 RepID=A0A329MT05_9BACL|nr:LacI family DNA-binding transcriptional regulator [Paenibacillus contaminans]RAV22428.1 LacI family transcriptional regulator [Paenibacillus contaminans]
MVTRDDVAKRAGVSVAVVSYVMNNKNNVKETTRQKVLQAIEELGYNPNQTARSLKTKKTGQFGVLFNSLGNPFETGISLGLEERARQTGQSLIFQTYIPSEEDKLRTIFMGRTDGLLLMGQSLKPETLVYFGKIGIPVYSITTPAKAHSSVRCIDIDWREAMFKLIEHLKSLGHTRIGFMAHSSLEHHLHVRFVHFLKAMEAHGLDFHQNDLLHGGGQLEMAYANMTKLLQKSRELPFTAIVGANDLMGIGMLSACKDSGLSVPRDLSVAACENILMASHTTPGLTTLHYPRREIGFKAFDMIMQEAGSGGKAADYTMGCELIVRLSTGEARK